MNFVLFFGGELPETRKNKFPINCPELVDQK
jgi:hypothetical protein